MFKDLYYQFFRMFVSLLPWGAMRTKWLVKKKIFQSVGENFYFCPRKIPADPKYIIFHNNVSIAADVVFCNHDVMYRVFNNLGEKRKNGYVKFYGCIEVMDNVFIGAKSIIMPNVRIGSNVIVAAGSIVTKDLQSGGVYAGNPARRIGDFEKLVSDRTTWSQKWGKFDEKSLQDHLWQEFFTKRNEDLNA